MNELQRRLHAYALWEQVGPWCETGGPTNLYIIIIYKESNINSCFVFLIHYLALYLTNRFL